jgi:hypothetical protein
VAPHSVGHNPDDAKNRSETVLLQSVTLTLRTGRDVGRRAGEDEPINFLAPDVFMH